MNEHPKSKPLADERRDYTSTALLEANCPDDPLDLFRDWLEQALQAKLKDATAMALASVDVSGQPSVRIVLLKEYADTGFTFFTRYSTRKSEALANNPRVGLLFHYREFDRQVHIEGRADRLVPGENAEYFASRPRGSQLSAHAASGLREVEQRAELERRYREAELRFAGQDVPLPSDWGGYRVAAHSIEFWQGRASRLHDRIRYERTDSGDWRRFRLAP